jgi:hypothetical protein
MAMKAYYCIVRADGKTISRNQNNTDMKITYDIDVFMEMQLVPIHKMEQIAEDKKHILCFSAKATLYDIYKPWTKLDEVLILMVEFSLQLAAREN